MSNMSQKRKLKEMKDLQEVEGYAKVEIIDMKKIIFVLKGSSDTPFENGEYVGEVNLPSDYPNSAPSIKMLTPSGRFEPNVNICTSISNFHPETWSPVLTIKTVLIAFQSFMNAKDDFDHAGTAKEMLLSIKEREKLQRKYAENSKTYNIRFSNLFESNSENSKKRKIDDC